MNRHADIRDHILTAIRSGTLRPGSQLSIQHIADGLSVSPIPVRENLCRMVGEGILIDRRGLGFFVPRLDTHDLVCLYRLRRLLVIAAARSVFGRPRPPATAAPGDLIPAGTAIDAMLGALLGMAGDAMLAQAWATSEYRLLPYRHWEPAAGGNEKSIASEVGAAIAARDLSRLNRLATRFFRQCELLADALVRAARSDEISSI